MNLKFRHVALAALVAAGGLSSQLRAGAITPGDLLVYQVGASGGGTLSSAATAPFIDEFSIAGASVQQLTIPTADSGSQHALTNSGTATSEGNLTISPNGTYVAFGGYDLLPGTTGAAASTVARVVGVLNTATGTIDTSTALTDAYSGNNIRSAFTGDGTTIYTGGTGTTNGGVHYATLGSTTSTQLTAVNGNTRVASVYNGQLYISAASTSSVEGIGTVGSGTPTTTGQAITATGIDQTGTVSPYEYAFTSLGGSTDPDTAYVADSGVGIEKWSLVGTTWTETGSVALANVTGIAAVGTGSSVQLYATTPAALYSLSDTSGYDGTLTGTAASIATAATGTAFRGLVAVPVPEPTSVGLLAAAGGLATLARRKRRASI